MKESCKVDIILDHLNISNKELATIFGVSESMISQIKSPKSKKLKRVYILALLQAFNLPATIFSNEVSSKEEIIALLEKKDKKTIHNTPIQSTLKGVFYIYSDIFEDAFMETQIVIRDSEIFLAHSQEKIGESIELNNKTLLVIEYNTTKITLTIYHALLNSKAFFASAEKISSSYKIENTIALITLKKNSLESAKALLEQSGKAAITHTMLEKLQKSFQAPTKVASSNELQGLWYFYYNEQEHMMIIEKSGNIFLYTNHHLSMKGELIDKRLLHLHNKKGKTLHIILNSYDHTIYLSYINIQNAWQTHVTLRGVLSKKRLSYKELEKTLSYKQQNRVLHFQSNKSLNRGLRQKELSFLKIV